MTNRPVKIAGSYTPRVAEEKCRRVYEIIDTEPGRHSIYQIAARLGWHHSAALNALTAGEHYGYLASEDDRRKLWPWEGRDV